MKYFLEEPYSENIITNSGRKARMDITHIAREAGFCPLRIDVPYVEVIKKTDLLKKAFFRPALYWAWFKVLKQLHSDDIILLQLPLTYNVEMIASILSAVKKRGVKIIAVLHDLSFLRRVDGIEKINKKSFKYRSEVRLLKCCDRIIVHNAKMKKFMADYLSIDRSRLISLGVFDYLHGDCEFEKRVSDYNGGVVFAGNLDKTKSMFLRDLPLMPDFELYGENYHKKETGRNVHYHGAFQSEELPKVMSGNYGLVWDGDSCDTCCGNYGHYLKYNNPHKMSLYLSLGLPVVIWEEAALADFILESGCGIAVKSLGELSETLESVDVLKYVEMKNAAETEGKKLRGGFYTKRALDECLADLE